MKSKTQARLVSERVRQIVVVAVSQLAPKDVLSPKQLNPAESPFWNADLVRLPFKEIRRCRQTSSFVKKR